MIFVVSFQVGFDGEKTALLRKICSRFPPFKQDEFCQGISRGERRSLSSLPFDVNVSNVLCQELKQYIDEYSTIYDPTDEEDWRLVVSEVTSFIDVSTLRGTYSLEDLLNAFSVYCLIFSQHLS